MELNYKMSFKSYIDFQSFSEEKYESCSDNGRWNR